MDQKIRNSNINITYRWYLSRVVLGIMTTARSVWVHGDRACLLVRQVKDTGKSSKRVKPC